jgi:hypothetical protein
MELSIARSVIDERMTMNFLDSIADAIKPHTVALGKVADIHASRITNVLNNIERGVSDLGRAGYDDQWGVSVINLPGTGNFDLTPDLRCRMNQIILIQSIVITAIPTAAGEALTLTTDSGIVKFTTGRTITTGSGTYSPLDDTIIVGGAIAILPGEHVTVGGTSGTTGQIVVNYIYKNINVEARSADTGESNEKYTGKNPHEIERDEILTVTGQYQDPPAAVRASNGLINERTFDEYERVGLDPTSV